MCEEKERKDKTVKEDISIAGEAEAGGGPSEAIKHILELKDYDSINRMSSTGLLIT